MNFNSINQIKTEWPGAELQSRILRSSPIPSHYSYNIES